MNMFTWFVVGFIVDCCILIFWHHIKVDTRYLKIGNLYGYATEMVIRIIKKLKIWKKYQIEVKIRLIAWSLIE